MQIGDAITYVDPVSVEHPALITAVWGTPEQDDPSVNLLWVSSNEAEHDQYGRQISRATSVVHTSRQGAHGNYWK